MEFISFAPMPDLSLPTLRRSTSLANFTPPLSAPIPTKQGFFSLSRRSSSARPSTPSQTTFTQNQLWRHSTPSTILLSATPEFINRQEIIHELITTEEAFAQNILAISTTTLPLVKSHFKSSDFSRIKTILQKLALFSTNLHSSMSLHLSNHIYNIPAIVNIIMVSDLSVYSEYVEIYPKILKKLNAVLNRNCLVNSEFLKPIQRLCKYPLFLTTLQKTYSSGSPATPKIQDAIDRIQAQVSRINNHGKTCIINRHLRTKYECVMYSCDVVVSEAPGVLCVADGVVLILSGSFDTRLKLLCKVGMRDCAPDASSLSWAVSRKISVRFKSPAAVQEFAAFLAARNGSLRFRHRVIVDGVLNNEYSRGASPLRNSVTAWDPKELESMTQRSQVSEVSRSQVSVESDVGRTLLDLNCARGSVDLGQGEKNVVDSQEVLDFYFESVIPDNITLIDPPKYNKPIRSVVVTRIQNGYKVTVFHTTNTFTIIQKSESDFVNLYRSMCGSYDFLCSKNVQSYLKQKQCENVWQEFVDSVLSCGVIGVPRDCTFLKFFR